MTIKELCSMLQPYVTVVKRQANSSNVTYHKASELLSDDSKLYDWYFKGDRIVIDWGKE